jgi:hypothetical protein
MLRVGVEDKCNKEIVEIGGLDDCRHERYWEIWKNLSFLSQMLNATS